MEVGLDGGWVGWRFGFYVVSLLRQRMAKGIEGIKPRRIGVK
jgi:hypothetical protein